MKVFLLMERGPEGDAVQGVYSTPENAAAGRDRWAYKEAAWKRNVGLPERAAALIARDYDTYNDLAYPRTIEIVPMELDADSFGKECDS